MPRVLLVGLSKQETRQCQSIFSSMKLECEVAPALEAAIEKLSANPPALILAAQPARPDELQSIRETLKQSSPTTSILVALSQPNLQNAMQMMKAGAYDCLIRPLDRFDVLAAAKR